MGARYTDSVILPVMDFCKAFNTFPHNILAYRLEIHGFDGWTIQWIKKWVDISEVIHIQRISVNGLLSKWKLVVSGEPIRSVLLMMMGQVHS